MPLLHPILPTKFRIDDMNIGDAISCEYFATSGGKGQFYKLGEAEKPLIDPLGSATPDGSFFFIKTDNGTLIADRCIQHSITWNALNSYGYIDGDFIYSLENQKITSDISEYATTIGSTQYNSYYRWKAFNKSNNDIVNDAFITTDKSCELGLVFNNKFKFNTILLSSQNNTSTPLEAGKRSPKDFDILVTDNGIDWIVVLSVTNQTNWNNDETREYKIPDEFIDDYIGYKIKVHNNNGDATYTSIGEVRLVYSGTPMDRDILIRSLSGGNCYIDQYGNPTLKQVDVELGAYPPNNEYDKYIKRSNLNKRIIPGDNNIWNYRDILTICKDTPVIGTWTNIGNTTVSTSSSYRVFRGYENRLDNQWKNITPVSSTSSLEVQGFRPILIYKERYGKNTTLFY